jgi:hypothetical protein
MVASIPTALPVPRRDGVRTTHNHVKRWVAAGLLVGADMLVPGTALAGLSPTTAGRDYGQHVVSCAHEMGGFDGTRNPGIHHGFAGYQVHSC